MSYSTSKRFETYKTLGPDDLHPGVQSELLNELGPIFAHLHQQPWHGTHKDTGKNDNHWWIEMDHTQQYYLYKANRSLCFLKRNFLDLFPWGKGNDTQGIMQAQLIILQVSSPGWAVERNRNMQRDLLPGNYSRETGNMTVFSNGKNRGLLNRTESKEGLYYLWRVLRVKPLYLWMTLFTLNRLS